MIVREVYCLGDTEDGECNQRFYISVDSERCSCCCPFCGAELDLTLNELDGVDNRKYKLFHIEDIGDMKLKDILKVEPIYKIFDLRDKNYQSWYGTIGDIVNYLEEQGLSLEDGWVSALSDIGLTFKELNF